jgi:endonuclease/exonuclease/phosphatase family metal-dependent hydrolase
MNETKLTIMTFNVHHARGPKRKIDLENVAATISRYHVDIACLQELDNGTRRTGGMHQAAEIARLADMDFVFGSSRRRCGGEFGNAILSRFRIEKSEKRFVSRFSVFQQRSVLAAHVQFNGAGLSVLNTHLGIIGEERARQIRDIMHFAESLDGHVVLCGDFNTHPKQKLLELIRGDFVEAADEVRARHLRTFHAKLPLIRYDYIFRKRSAPLRCVSVRVARTDVSDHLPLIAAYSLATPHHK